ncbi:MAG: UDP-N-acetyl-D-glucosamine dehydrogenase [Gemmatimonas sp. SG8_23]|nr:MAG: UDP-N-acetyl-D-glucosamine dehydrogenase [Gemmatimonas sp. SG8_23]
MTPPERDVRTAVVGAGYLGRFHAQKYAAAEGSELVAVVDPDEERRDAVGAEVGAEPLAHHAELVGRVDAVSIVTPTRSHYEIAKDLLQAGVHVLVEKPITVTAEEAGELVALAGEKDLVLQVGHLERFNAAILGVAPLLVEPRFIESHRLAPFNPRGADVSVVLDLMIHDVDLILNMVKSPIVSIDANGASVISEEPDIANARIRFDNGCVANVTASRITPRVERKIRIFQHHAYMSIDLHARKTAVYRKDGDGLPTPLPGITMKHAEYPEGDALATEIAAFLHSVRTGEPPVVSGEDGKRALETVIEIQRLVEGAAA